MKNPWVKLAAFATVVVLIGATIVITSNSSSSKQTHVTFAYDFPFADMELIPVIVAQKEGFFKAEGLDVSIALPPSTTTTVQMVATGAADVAMLSTADLVDGVNAKAPLVSIGNYSMTNNWGLFAKPGSTLSLATLKGTKVFSWGDNWTNAMLPFVLKKAGLSSSDITVVSGDSDTPMLLQNKVDFLTNTTNYAIPGITEATGKAPVQIVGKDAGVPDVPVWVYGSSTKYAKDHGDTLRKFMKALGDATQWSIDHQGKAVAYFDKAYPDSGYSHAYNVQAWKLTVPLLTNAQGQFFVQSDAQWSKLAKALVAVGQIESAKQPSAYFTNTYLP